MTVQPTQGFPRALLDQPIAMRRRYFEMKVVAHQRLKDIYGDLLQTIRYPAGKSLIFVVGPTGVGKTTLLQRTVKQLIEDARADALTSPGHIPVMAMEAPSPDSGNFSWKDYFTRALMAADDPQIAEKIVYVTRGICRDETGHIHIDRALSAADLRRVLEKCLLHRQPRAFIVDEAQHIKKMASGRRLLDQMDTLKSLANMSTTVHVLIGTYELLGMVNLSAQLARRSLTLHFPRYHADQPNDFKEFQKLLRTFQWHLPFPEESDLESHVEYFYEQCLGCTGMLKGALNAVVGAALEQGDHTLTQRRWEQQREPHQKLKEMLQAIKEDEAKLRDQNDERHRQTLRTLLHLDTSPLPVSSSSDHPTLPSPQHAVSPKGTKRQRVGQRSARRDRIGKEENHDNRD